MEKWDRLLRVENIVVGLQSARKFDAIRELSTVLADDDAIVDHARFLADVIRREKQATTGIGRGVALPHVHEDIVRRQILAVGISPGGIEFAAVDGQPVQIVALFASPQKHHKQHMELLAALSRLLQQGDVRQSLIEAPDAATVLSIFTSRGT
ncbi:MAG: PTS sugar transporter subunit IIA [Gemmatimonadota bacterium]